MTSAARAVIAGRMTRLLRSFVVSIEKPLSL
jgi:hypothetical protein